MATVVWLGSPDGPDEVEWLGKKFKKGEALEVEDEGILAKAAANHFFKVEGYEAAAPKHDAPLTYRSATEQSAQGPVPKPGEPIVPQAATPPDNLGPPPPEGGGGETPVAEKAEGHHPAVRAAIRTPSRGR